MNARLLVAIALVFAAVAARAEETESSELSNVETVEPTFVETAAVAQAETEAEGFPFRLPRKMRETTREPRYYGEDGRRPKEFVHPEYRDPHPRRHHLHKHKHNHHHGRRHHKKPSIFVSHYFSPMPKEMKGLKMRVRRDRAARRLRHLVPFRARVETPTRHLMHKRGHVTAEIRNVHRLPNKFDDPRKRHKKTRTPAPIVFLENTAEAHEEDEATEEVDTTDEMEAEEGADAALPPFQHDLGEEAARIVAPDQFYDANFQTPAWKDEEATEASLVEVTADAAEEEEAEDEEEAEEEEESEDEEEADEESEEEADEESDEESEDEAEEEAEDEAEEEAPVSLMEAGASVEFDASDAEADEMEQNEIAAQQIDMDATSDEAAMTEEVTSDAEDASEEVISTTVENLDADELSADSEADFTEEVIEEGEALDEAETADAVSLVEEEAEADNEAVDTLLAEVDSHLSGEGEGEGEADSEAHKGTPGHSIAAGQTWEEAQNARLNAMEAKLAADKAAVPRVAAAMVSSKAELHAMDAAHQAPEYDTPAAHEELLEPELMVEAGATASPQTVLLEKIAKLKAIRRA